MQPLRENSRFGPTPKKAAETNNRAHITPLQGSCGFQEYKLDAEGTTMISATRRTRREFLQGARGAAAAIVATSIAKPAIAQTVKVRYTLSWLPTGQYAFLYCARQLGYFKQRGIELDIARGYGSMAAIRRGVNTFDSNRRCRSCWGGSSNRITPGGTSMPLLMTSMTVPRPDRSVCQFGSSRATYSKRLSA